MRSKDKYKHQAKKIRNPGTLAIAKVCFPTLVGKHREIKEDT